MNNRLLSLAFALVFASLSALGAPADECGDKDALRVLKGLKEIVLVVNEPNEEAKALGINVASLRKLSREFLNVLKINEIDISKVTPSSVLLELHANALPVPDKKGLSFAWYSLAVVEKATLSRQPDQDAIVISWKYNSGFAAEDKDMREALEFSARLALKNFGQCWAEANISSPKK